MPTPKLEYKTREKEEKWVRAVNAFLSGTLPFFLSMPEGEVSLFVGDEAMWSLIIRKDGTWTIE